MVDSSDIAEQSEILRKWSKKENEYSGKNFDELNLFDWTLVPALKRHHENAVKTVTNMRYKKTHIAIGTRCFTTGIGWWRAESKYFQSIQDIE